MTRAFARLGALIGTVVGSAVAGRPADVWGRKAVLFALAVGHVGSLIRCGLAPEYSFLAARFVGGLSIGGASVVVSLYIAEVSPPARRGGLVARNHLNVVGGILQPYLSNSLIAGAAPPDAAWRWMLGGVAVPSAVFFGCLFLIPESPRWLVLAGRAAEARAVFARLGSADPAGDTATAAAAVRAAAAPGLGGRPVQPALRHQRADVLRLPRLRDGRGRPGGRANAVCHRRGGELPDYGAGAVPDRPPRPPAAPARRVGGAGRLPWGGGLRVQHGRPAGRPGRPRRAAGVHRLLRRVAGGQ